MIRGRWSGAAIGSGYALIAALAVAGCSRPVATESVPPPGTTGGGIARGNLEAELEALERSPHCAASQVVERRVDLLLARARFFDILEDLERAEDLVAELVEQHPTPSAYLLRARVAGRLHRFEDAVSDLERAAVDPGLARAVDATAVSLLQALGRSEDALALALGLVDARSDVHSRGLLATLHAERGEWYAAEVEFAAARAAYRDTAPFPIAWLEVEEGKMWLGRGDTDRARSSFRAALGRLPGYVRAGVLLAETEEAAGRPDAAIAVLESLVHSAGDPEVAGHLARLLDAVGRPAEAHPYRRRAATRFEALLVRHPEAFADHAAEFYAGVGADPQRAAWLAEQNFRLRPTAAAAELRRRVAAAADGSRGSVVVPAA